MLPTTGGRRGFEGFKVQGFKSDSDPRTLGPSNPLRRTLSIVIPAFNEEQGILPILQRVLSLRPQLAAAGLDGPEVIVVDDGSRDRTAELVGSVPEVRMIRHSVNRGYGGR